MFLLFLSAIWFKMAHKWYTFERLNGVAANSAAKWRTTLQVKDLRREYVQVTTGFKNTFVV